MRPNIYYVVGLLCKFINSHSIEHCHAIERVMRYHKRTMNLKLKFQEFLVVLEGYNDIDRNTLLYDSESTSNCIFSIAGGKVS